jgi:glycosyltransferase involved in cell wall biosynthesis
MEQVARIHLSRGEPVVSLFGEKGNEAGVHYLGLSHNNSIHTARAALRKALETFPGAAFLYYNGYALDWLDRKSIPGKPVLYLHSDYPGLLQWVRPLLHHADGCLCVNDRLAEKLRHITEPDQIQALPLPVDEHFSTSRKKAEGEPIIIGYSGRVEIEQKRMDRLAGFVQAMEALQQPFIVEILGNGSYLETLEKDFAGDNRVIFHGYLTGSAYREAISRWRYILFMSDYEGLPVSLLEGVAAGCLPVYPDFHDGQDWLDSLVTDSYYPVGDMQEAASVIERVESQWEESDWQAFRGRAEEQVSRHTRPAYLAAIASALDAIGSLGRDSSDGKPAWPGIAPVWLYNRLRTWCQHKRGRNNV